MASVVRNEWFGVICFVAGLFNREVEIGVFFCLLGMGELYLALKEDIPI